MTVTQTIEWQAVLTDRTAPAMASIRASAERAAGRLSAVNVSMTGVSAGMKRLEQAAPKLQGALARVGFAAGGMLGPLGSVATLLGPGAPLMLGIAGAAFAFTSIKKSVDESAVAADAWRGTLQGLADQVSRTTENALKPSRDMIKSMADEIRFFGMDARTVKLNLAHDEADMLRMRLGNVKKAQAELLSELEKNEGLYRRAHIAGDQELVEKFETSAALADMNRKKIEGYSTALEEAEANVFRMAEQVGALNDLERQRERERAASRGSSGGSGGAPKGEAAEEFDADLWLMQERAKAMQHASDQRIASMRSEAEERKRAQAEQAKAWADMERAQTEATRREAEERARIAEDALRYTTEQARGLTMGYATAAAGILGGLANDLATQQEHSLERAALAVAERTGNELVGQGVTVLGAGAASLAMGNLPAAALQGAIGGGLVTAGIGMGATTAALAQRVQGLGGSSGGAAMSERGLSSAPVTRSGGASGGEAQVNNYVVNYVSGGPTAEQGARTQVALARRAQSRLLEGVTRR